MKKIIFTVIFSLTFIAVASTHAYAAQINSQAQEVYDSLPDETQDVLYSFGIDGTVDSDIFNVSFSQVFSALMKIFTSGIKEPLSFTCRMLAVILITAVFSTLAGDFEKIISLFCTFMCCAAALNGISGCINALMSSAKICSDFMLAYVPVFAVIVSLSGSPASALTYNTAVLTFSEIISRFSSTCMLPVCGALLSAGTAFSLNPVLNPGRLTAAVNKLISTVTGIIMSVFTAVLSLKGIMSGAADSLASRGIKLVFTSFVPVIGGALSEAYSSITGSISLAKGSVAVFGIAAVFALNLPVLLHSAVYGIALSFLSYVSDATGFDSMNTVFGLMKCTLRLVSMIVIMQIFLIVISTGIILLTKGT